MHIRIHT